MSKDKLKSLEKQAEVAIADGKRIKAFFLGLKMLWLRKVELFSFIDKELAEEVKNGES